MAPVPLADAPRPRHLHRLTVLVTAAVLLTSAVAWTVTSRVVADNDERLLREQADQVGLLMLSMTSSMTSPFLPIGTDLRAGRLGNREFAAVAAGLRTQGYAAIALVRSTPTGLRVVATHGRLAGNPRTATTRTTATHGGLALGGLVSRGEYVRYSTVVGSPTLPNGYALYAEQPISTASSSFTPPGLAFDGMSIALYYGSEAAPVPLYSTGDAAPTKGHRAVVVIDTSVDPRTAWSHIDTRIDPPKPVSAAGAFIIVLRPTKHLAGTVAGVLPWALLAIGVLGAFVLGGIIETALRRRDLALTLVDHLEEKNTELDAALDRQARTEAELRQAQRLEAVGQLAGGIAHDFNNLLAVIISFAGFVADELEDSPLRADVEEIRRAAGRAAELTRQLLIFSRRDVVRPVVLDINEVVSETERLLQWTLGEDVVLVRDLDAEPCLVKADAGEIEQVLVNLAVNGRDAMPGGGTLRIATAHDDITADDGVQGLEPGLYVRLTVTDTGVGMTDEVVSRAFEPFFTTKDTGQGSGLGLATVYGIATRFGGHARVDSAPGEGTSVTIWLPAETAYGAIPQQLARPEPRRGDGRVVLVVEDEEAVRMATRRMLVDAGYRVLEAENGAAALAVALETDIDVLVTDVIMPGGISGKNLAEAIRSIQPRTAVVYVSGYSSDYIAKRGVLDPGVTLVAKPFERSELLRALSDELSGIAG